MARIGREAEIGPTSELRRLWALLARSSSAIWPGIGCIQMATAVQHVQGLKIFCDPLADAYIGLGWVSWREPAAMRGRNLPPRKITIPPWLLLLPAATRER